MVIVAVIPQVSVLSDIAAISTKSFMLDTSEYKVRRRKKSVLRIQNRMFLGLPNPHPDPLVTSTDPAPDPSIIKQK